MITGIYEFLSNELVNYIIQCVTIVGSVVCGVATLYKKSKTLFTNATNLLNQSNEDVKLRNKSLEHNSAKLDQVIAKYEEGIADNEKLRNELREVLETLKPLLNLPSAISSIVNSQPDMIKKGVAKRVNDILGFNKDNVKDVKKEQ